MPTEGERVGVDAPNGPDGAPPTLPCIDLRGLAAPEPLECALAAVDALSIGQRLELLTPAMPYPLLDVLGARGLAVSAERLPDGSARVSVCCPA